MESLSCKELNGNEATDWEFHSNHREGVTSAAHLSTSSFTLKSSAPLRLCDNKGGPSGKATLWEAYKSYSKSSVMQVFKGDFHYWNQTKIQDSRLNRKGDPCAPVVSAPSLGFHPATMFLHFWLWTYLPNEWMCCVNCQWRLYDITYIITYNNL